MFYESFLNTINIIFLVILIVDAILLIYKIISHIVGLFPGKKYPDAKENHKYAIVVSARNESKVIADFIESVKKQKYPQELIDIVIIADNCTDNTADIARKNGANFVFERFNKEFVGKGYALNFGFKKLFEEFPEKNYDAFFIFDADNVLAENYVFEMNKVFDAGYKMALGYRNSKNWNDGWVASCSALVFSMINTFQNKCRSRFNMNIVVSGTGFYISSDVIKKWGGWPFHTLTEDYEVSLNTCLQNIKSTYCEWAEYFDEQPRSLKVSWTQRVRWVKGFQQNNKTKRKLLKSAIIDKNNRWSKIEFWTGVIPVAAICATAIAYCLINFIWGVVGLFLPARPVTALINFAITVLVVYFFFVLYATIMLLAERKHINITFKNAINCVFMAPFFFGLFLPIYIFTLFKKEVQWVPIEHSVCAKQIIDVEETVKTKN